MGSWQVVHVAKPPKIPVLIPDSRESGRESGLLRTTSTAILFIINNLYSNWSVGRTDVLPVQVSDSVLRLLCDFVGFAREAPAIPNCGGPALNLKSWRFFDSLGSPAS
jgi:hypothetical protein